MQGRAVRRRHAAEGLVERSKDRRAILHGAGQCLVAGGDPAHHRVATIHEVAQLVLFVGQRLHDDVEVRQDSIEFLLSGFADARQWTEVRHGVVQRRKGGADVLLPAIQRDAQLLKGFGHRLSGWRVHGVEDVVDLDRLAGLALGDGGPALQVGLVALLRPDQLDKLFA